MHKKTPAVVSKRGVDDGNDNDGSSLEDYAKVFEDIWQARADSAGWNLRIEGKGKQITFYLTR